MPVFLSLTFVTLTEGQGHKGQVQRSQKETLAYILETIEATVTKFGTNVLGDNTLQIISYTMTLTEGQGHKGQGQRSKQQHCHISRKLLKLQLTDLAQRYFVTMGFTRYRTL